VVALWVNANNELNSGFKSHQCFHFAPLNFAKTNASFVRADEIQAVHLWL
jgi:hypothetical protein